jgi:uncharacterized lipoprotein YmbA
MRQPRSMPRSLLPAALALVATLALAGCESSEEKAERYWPPATKRAHWSSFATSLSTTAFTRKPAKPTPTPF